MKEAFDGKASKQLNFIFLQPPPKFYVEINAWGKNQKLKNV